MTTQPEDPTPPTEPPAPEPEKDWRTADPADVRRELRKLGVNAPYRT